VTDEKYLLEMKNIVKTFPGVQALKRVQLQVLPGEIHALMGENGAGKSTLMKCIAGIYHPTVGKSSLMEKTGDLYYRGSAEDGNFHDPSGTQPSFVQTHHGKIYGLDGSPE